MLNELADSIHTMAAEKGWYERDRGFPEVVALMHSELSEALEEYRNGHKYNEVYFEGDKPEGIMVELADTIIRILDWVGRCRHLMPLDFDEILQQKLDFNLTRPHRHGGKLA